MAKQYYSTKRFQQDVANAVVRRIEARIADKKKEGILYLEVEYNLWAGMNCPDIRVIVAATLSFRGYAVTWGIVEDKMVVSRKP